MSASRYAHSEQLRRPDASGRPVRYLAARILPLGETVAGSTGTLVKATEVNRLDLVAYRALRDPEQAWRIADANDAMDPFELTTTPGVSLKVPGSLL